MNPIRTAAVALLGAVALASPAAAWTSLSLVQAMGSQPLIYAYPTANYCPQGLQPVTIGGVICCGVPTAHGYHQPVHRKPVHKPYVAYGKGYNESTPVYEKGQ